MDVTARHPSGEVRRLLVECKDWNKTVGKGTLDALVGVRDQIGADAAAVATTKGFSKGARRVAADEDIAMVLLRPPEDKDEGRFIKKIVLGLTFLFPSHRDFDISLREGHGLPKGGELRFELDEDTRLHHLDGSPAETFGQIKKSQGSVSEGAGTFKRTVTFPEGRLLTAVDGAKTPIAKIRWMEEVREAQETQIIEKDGDPCLVLEQLDSDGVPISGRMFVDDDLYAWEVANDGSVISRRGLDTSRP